MTVIRLALAGAESRSATEVTSFGIPILAIVSTPVYTGTYAFDGGDANDDGQGFAFPVAYDAIRMSFMFRHEDALNTITTNSVVMVRFRNAGVNVFAVNLDDTTGLATLFVNGVEQDSVSMASAGLSDVGTWRHIGATCHIGDPGYASFYVDGVKYLEYVGAITGEIDNVHFFASGNGNWGSGGAYWDDIYVDAIEGELDSAPSTRRFLWSLPDGAGANAAWTPNAGLNYAAVDEAVPDDDTTYIKTLVPGVRDTYHYAPIAVPVDHVIRAVIVYPYLRKTDAATPAEVGLHAYDGLTYLESANLENLSTDYTFRFARFTAQPDAEAWNEADFNTMQFGITAEGAW